MPGANCSIVGCSTSRRDKEIAIFRLPTDKNDQTRKWRADMLNIITRDRQVDQNLRKQIANNALHVCERHFNEEDLYYYPTRKQLKEGVLPTKNLPVKSILKDQQQTERPTNAIEKRETHFQQQTLQEQLEPSSPIYKNFDNFLARSKQLKLNLWSIIEHSKCTVEIQRREEQILLPYMQIFVCEDLSFVLRCFGWIVPEDNKIYSIHPTFKYVTLSSFITFLQGYIICSGLDLVEFREAIHLKHHIVPSLFVFDKSSKPISPVCQQEYIRSAVCRLLIPSNSTLIKCQDCRKLEVKTRSQISHQKVTTAEPAKLQAPVKFTSPERLVATLKNHRLKNKMLLNRIAEMTTALQSHSLPVDTVLNDDLVDIFKGVPTEKIPPFMKLFWEEQQKYIRTTHSSQIRYHPAVIKYCLSIAAKSPAAYNQLRLDKKEGTGVLILPSQRTLRDYRNYIRPRQGFNPAVVKELATKTSSFSESEKFVTILFDEMKVQEDLVWDKNTGNLIGYVDLGDDDINQGVLKDCEKLASHILVFLVKSIKNPMSYSFANFATDGVTSYQMFTLFWKAVSILELSCQLKVVAVVSDGAASNRKFVRMNKNSEDICDVTYRTENDFATDDRYIYFFGDAPHLIKTARNCLWKSGSSNSQRYMWNKGNYLLWQHVSHMHKEDVECGLKLMPKLTADHVYLNSYSVMRVYLATQVLSESVGKVLNTFGPPEAKGTAEFCLKFDCFFDCLNVRNTKEHLLKRKSFLRPYKEVEDPRFTWLDSFLEYLKNWKQSIDERPGDFSATQRNNMFISAQTYEGVRMSIYSLKDIIPYLLNNGLDYVLSERFCQDDIENYFGRQRAIGRRKDNPNVRDTLYADNIIKTQYDVKPIQGNVRNTSVQGIDDTPLKKRKTSK